jgi:hypothetical protein
MQKLLTKREKSIFYITVGVIISAIGFNFLIAPILTKNDILNREINLNRKKLQKYLRLLAQKDYMQGKYGSLATSASLNEKQQDILVIALSELEELSKSANIKITDIRPQSTAKSLIGYKEAIIELRAEGTIEGYLKFIYNLEHSLTLLKIRKFRLTAKPNSQALEGSFSISQLSALD